MKDSKSHKDSSKKGGGLKNFRLSVEEIKLIRAIKEMAQSLEYIEHKNIQPERQEFFRNEIRALENQLEDIRDNTLIR
jgi:hypothetical protein